MTDFDKTPDSGNTNGSGTDDSVEHPHDSFFRQLMSKPFAAVEMLRGWLPAAVADGLDWATLEPAPANYVDADLRQTHGDCLFLVQPVGAADGFPPVHVYVLVEHQSTADPSMPFRILRYMVRTWEGYQRENPGATRLPAIYPVVVFQGPGNWTPSPAFEDMIEIPPRLRSHFLARTPSFRHDLVDLGSLHPDTARSLMAYTLSRGMWLARQGDLRVLAFFDELPREAVEAFRSGPSAEVLEGLLYYYVVISDSLSWDMIADKAGKTGLGREVVMGLAQRTREEGRQQGTRAEAIRMIDLCLVNRFRMVPGTVTGRLEEIAEVERLEALMKVAVTASSADDFFAALDAEAAR